MSSPGLFRPRWPKSEELEGCVVVSVKPTAVRGRPTLTRRNKVLCQSATGGFILSSPPRKASVTGASVISRYRIYTECKRIRLSRDESEVPSMFIGDTLIKFNSKLPPHTRCPAIRRISLDPISGCGPIRRQPQWPSAHYSHNKCHRGDRSKEQKRQDDWIHHFCQCATQFRPSSIEPRQARRCKNSEQQQQSARKKDQTRDQGDRPRREHFCRTDHHQDATDRASERPIAASFGGLLITIAFVKREILAHLPSPIACVLFYIRGDTNRGIVGFFRVYSNKLHPRWDRGRDVH